MQIEHKTEKGTLLKLRNTSRLLFLINTKRNFVYFGLMFVKWIVLFKPND